jgi:hypothetical protein
MNGYHDHNRIDMLIIDWQIRNLPPIHHRPKRQPSAYALARQETPLGRAVFTRFSQRPGLTQVYLRRKE